MRTYHGRNCADDENNSGNTSCQQSSGASGQTKGDEDVGGIVNDGIDTTVSMLVS